MTTLETIIEAIKNRHVLKFTYSGLSRVVEPHAVGVSRAGKDSLRCFQTFGSHVTEDHEWDFCTLSEIESLEDTGVSFSGTRPGYAKGDKHMTTIYAEL